MNRISSRSAELLQLENKRGRVETLGDRQGTENWDGEAAREGKLLEEVEVHRVRMDDQVKRTQQRRFRNMSQ